MPDGGTKPGRDRGGPRGRTQTRPSPSTRPLEPGGTSTAQAGDVALRSEGAVEVPLHISGHGGGLKSTLRLNKSTFLQEPQM